MKKLLAVALVALGAVPATAGAATFEFSNATPIAVPGTGNSGPSNPNPSAIQVNGVGGTITKLTATLVGIGHLQGGADIDVLLVAPNGQNAMIMSDACPGVFGPVDLTFDDASTATLPFTTPPPCASGTFRPTDITTGNDDNIAGAPPSPHGLTLAPLAVGNTTGTWNLFSQDDAVSGIGSIAGGWKLTFTTDAPDNCGGKKITIYGTNGKDTITGTAGDDVIAGLNGKDTIKGLGGNDTICGGNGKDTLKGGAGNDKLYGQNGKDKLVGGAGTDVLKGGKGKDTQIQ